MTNKTNGTGVVFIDAGVEHVSVREGETTTVLCNNSRIEDVIPDIYKNRHKYITGKLAETVMEKFGGETVISSAALWHKAAEEAKKTKSSVGVIELSASGYSVIAVNDKGDLTDDLLAVNPKCGAGSGINLKRILEKLDLGYDDVDVILSDYLGEKGREKRNGISVRADRCGVFSSSATISDKNQGIPLDHALATTMKSEVVKACAKMIRTDKVFLTGRVFLWQYMRDCASDYLNSLGIRDIEFKQDLVTDGLESLVKTLGGDFRKQQEKISVKTKMAEYPAFYDLKKKYGEKGFYERIVEDKSTENLLQITDETPVNIALDIGSTMAKVIVSGMDGKVCFAGSYTNHGDTVSTLKHIFKELKSKSSGSLSIQHIGITGSGRYQVQSVLKKVYPHLAQRVFVLVENYAHARGSIEYVKDHLKKNPDANKDYCVLVDIGGEDTKISVIDLSKEELFDNVMNIKCSAGTGSLMDTLKTLFNISDISEACKMAYNSPKAYEINATCAVFLMENAKKMQAEGYSTEEILASCNYAIVENMARTLWDQIEFPENAVVLLHGQTMQSDPLPLAVTHRISEFSKMYCLLPPLPGHRACFGLLKSAEKFETFKEIMPEKTDIDHFLNTGFNKKIFYCKGVACGDPDACCARTLITANIEGEKLSITLGGCTAVNDMSGEKKQKTPDAYNAVWKHFNSKLPAENDSNRLVIPRSFAVSEYSFLLAAIFQNIGIPVYVDNVREKDILEGQAYFSVDVCAPLIGSVGQYVRIAEEKHGMILAPQIDFLPAENNGLGRTCTINQGGISVSVANAMLKNPDARFCQISLDLSVMDPDRIAGMILERAEGLFEYYGIKKDISILKKAVEQALADNKELTAQINDLAADYVERAVEGGFNISIVCGREYILNPGIYDSHAGKLLRDKGVIALPSFALETEPDPDFSYVYWKIPQGVISLINAVASKKLHKILKNKRLAGVVEKIERGLTGSMISVVQVSTFRCGPDTMLSSAINNITKNIPSLLIQTDAMITELAHLENRVNTHISQIAGNLQKKTGEKFDLKMIDSIETDSLNKSTDVIYLPTLHDNRMVVSAFKAVGITVIANYEESDYSLEKKIRLGRKYVGDTVCAPLAAMFADIVLAMEDFVSRKKSGDPLVENKSRMLMFSLKGNGPCRQGQYFDVHKLIAHELIKDNGLNGVFKLLSAREDKGYNAGFDEQTLILSLQGFVLHGLFNSILLNSSRLKDRREYEEFYKDLKKLKEDIYEDTESFKLSPVSAAVQALLPKNKPAGSAGKLIINGMANTKRLSKILKKFSDKWHADKDKSGNDKMLKIYLTGEAYIRGAQAEDVFRAIVDGTGFGKCALTYSPVWTYMEILIEFYILKMEQDIKIFKMKNEKDLQIKELKKNIKKLRKVKYFSRKFITEPLYKAAGIDIPEKMSSVFEKTKKLIPNLRPEGELLAYVGESLDLAEKDYDLIFNLAPEGCMVSNMGQAMAPAIRELSGKNIRMQDLFTLNGELNEDQIKLSILKASGSLRYYSRD